MLNKSLLTNGIFAVALLHDMVTYRKIQKRLNEILEENRVLHGQVDHALYVANYMALKLADNDIDLSDFDIIALNNPM
ncbi:MAG: hypothetical protein ABIW84_08510 [Ilumatobacteraceae bacterium]